MQNPIYHLCTNRACGLAVAACLGLSCANQSLAQRPGPPDGAPTLKGEMRKSEVRETLLRKTDTGPAAEKVDPKRLAAAIEKMKEDFRQIQVVRNELVRALIANQPADYKFIYDRASEISKRTDRFRSFLLPQPSENREKNQPKPAVLDAAEVKAALVLLCNRIASLIDNPILKNPGLSDARQNAKAGDDLLQIINLSGSIKRSAERLKKESR